MKEHIAVTSKQNEVKRLLNMVPLDLHEMTEEDAFLKALHTSSDHRLYCFYYHPEIAFNEH
jgi:hypothetical protein